MAWTLEVEVQFYCAMPALAALFRVRPKLRRRAALAALIVLAGALQLAYWDGPQRARMSILYAIQFFLVSSAYFLLIERPCMRKDWPQRLLRRWK